MKNFDILGFWVFTGKSNSQGWESSQKADIHEKGDCLKRGGGREGGLARKRGVFEGGLIPQCTLCKPQYLFNLIQTGQDSYNTGNFDQVQT